MKFNGNEEALRSIRHKFSQFSKAQTQPSIYKVHKHLRNVNKKAYEPEIIAIGPYHHGKENLKLMEEHKLRYLESLLRRRNQNVEIYISAVSEMEQEARNCYAEPISLNAAQFIEMLLLDGCFIIELMLKNNEFDAACNNDPVFQMEWILNSLTRDLILFENQIPFFLLCKLFDLIEAPKQHNKLIDLLIEFFQGLYPGAVSVYGNWTDRSSQEVKHLLDLLHSNWRHSSGDDVYINVKPVFPLGRKSQLIPSATELRDANVQFQRRISNTLFDVDFKNGLMLMPHLVIHDGTESLFRNLIAYEQYFSENQPTFLTDYMTLLDCLINSPRDVEILLQCGIIDNWLGDNKQVADIINGLGNSVTCGGSSFIYADTFLHINAHHDNRWNRARAVLNRDYFSSPWAYISFVAALLLLSLTAAQTVFSAIQAFKS